MRRSFSLFEATNFDTIYIESLRKKKVIRLFLLGTRNCYTIFLTHETYKPPHKRIMEMILSMGSNGFKSEEEA